LTIDPGEIESAIGRRTKAIVPVHLYGQPAELAAIRDIAARHGLRVIEDCAQSVGARYHERRTGAWGDVGCYSFYPTKNLGALGDGGMVVTNSPEVAEQARMLREYGWRERYVSSIAGWNTRLDELQSAVLRVKLRHLDSDNDRRLQLARRYDNALRSSGLRLPCCKADRTHVYHLYVVRSLRRDGLREFLGQRGVGTMVHYPVPVHRQPAYADRLSSSRDLRESERAAVEVLSLPMFPELTDSDADCVVDAVLAFQREGA
jgi:dTDP-4-amino-4,6-dideoxygalactose transaminase